MINANCTFVVDDDSSARNGLARLLRTAGHDVRDFASSDDFLDALDPEVSGCVVLDARMPGLSGEELQAELKARGVHLTIIVVTGDDDPETKWKAEEMKVAGFFRKPVDGMALLDAIHWTLRSSSTGGNHNEEQVKIEEICSMSTKTVLVVDDDSNIRDIAVFALKKKFTVLAAPDGKKAWDILNSQNIDCLITDIEMPNMCGLELLENLKESGHLAKVIVSSGRNCPDLKKRCTGLGANHFLAKPYTIQELIESVHMLTN
ncbi:MAG: response regulator [Desulfobacteraceae bacterium]|nr:response regulator [Desulfobacteraceae bacterium]